MGAETNRIGKVNQRETRALLGVFLAWVGIFIVQGDGNQ